MFTLKKFILSALQSTEYSYRTKISYNVERKTAAFNDSYKCKKIYFEKNKSRNMYAQHRTSMIKSGKGH